MALSLTQKLVISAIATGGTFAAVTLFNALSAKGVGAVSPSVITRPNFNARPSMTDADFVNGLYTTVLGRPADTGGFATYTGYLANPGSQPAWTAPGVTPASTAKADLRYVVYNAMATSSEYTTSPTAQKTAGQPWLQIVPASAMSATLIVGGIAFGATAVSETLKYAGIDLSPKSRQRALVGRV